MPSADVPTIGVVLTPRQELILRKVVEAHTATGEPVGSKTLAADPELDCGPVDDPQRARDARGARPARAPAHVAPGACRPTPGTASTSTACCPATTSSRASAPLDLQLVRREVDEAMRMTTETLSQVTNLLAIVSAPPIDTATIRHVEVLLLQPQVLMVVVITSTGGVTKRVLHLRRRPSTRAWRRGPATYLNERLDGHRPRRAHAALAARRPVAGRHRARLPRAPRARLHRAGRHRRGHALRRRRRAPARRAPLPGPHRRSTS